MGAKFIPSGDRVLVSVIEQERMLEGVLLPDSAKEDMQAGLVVAVGESKFKPGDRVLFGPWAGKNIQLEGIPFRVMREAEIDGKVVSDEELAEERKAAVRLLDAASIAGFGKVVKHDSRNSSP